MKATINFLNETIENANAYCEYFSMNPMMPKMINRAIKNNDEKMLLCFLSDFTIQHHSTLYVFGRNDLHNEVSKAEYQKRVDALVDLQKRVTEFLEEKGFGC